VDVGIYGGRDKENDINGEQDFIIKNKELEWVLKNKGGIKFLCNMNYYDDELFWSIYNKQKYDSLKLKYDKKLFNKYL
jgi:hypothetical protein